MAISEKAMQRLLPILAALRVVSVHCLAEAVSLVVLPFPRFPACHPVSQQTWLAVAMVGVVLLDSHEALGPVASLRVAPRTTTKYVAMDWKPDLMSRWKYRYSLGDILGFCSHQCFWEIHLQIGSTVLPAQLDHPPVHFAVMVPRSFFFLLCILHSLSRQLHRFKSQKSQPSLIYSPVVIALSHSHIPAFLSDFFFVASTNSHKYIIVLIEYVNICCLMHHDLYLGCDREMHYLFSSLLPNKPGDLDLKFSGHLHNSQEASKILRPGVENAKFSCHPRRVLCSRRRGWRRRGQRHILQEANSY